MVKTTVIGGFKREIDNIMEVKAFTEYGHWWLNGTSLSRDIMSLSSSCWSEVSKFKEYLLDHCVKTGFWT